MEMTEIWDFWISATFGISATIWDSGIGLGFWQQFGISASIRDFGISLGFGIWDLGFWQISESTFRHMPNPKYVSAQQDDNIHYLYKEGFNNLNANFEEYLTENNITYNDKSGYFKIYSSVAIASTNII
ncbi:hypothetical protein C1645_813846 [Glomus cerebriforme]|uniref:Uncharacterized protein n=1 Tax=Glomus cerebriforme TaxID=658196 RepID=A0A397TMB2_9GLOM|nr:hypothetical protein C1645_813846 [Glomus cerebriforme]